MESSQALLKVSVTPVCPHVCTCRPCRWGCPGPSSGSGSLIVTSLLPHDSDSRLRDIKQSLRCISAVVRPGSEPSCCWRVGSLVPLPRCSAVPPPLSVQPWPPHGALQQGGRTFPGLESAQLGAFRWGEEATGPAPSLGCRTTPAVKVRQGGPRICLQRLPAPPALPSIATASGKPSLTTRIGQDLLWAANQHLRVVLIQP